MYIQPTLGEPRPRKPRRHMPDYGVEPTDEELQGMPTMGESSDEEPEPPKMGETNSTDRAKDKVCQKRNRVLGGLVLPIDEPKPGETLTHAQGGAEFEPATKTDDEDGEGLIQNRWRRKTRRQRVQRSLRQKQQIQELKEMLEEKEAKLEKRWSNCWKQGTRQKETLERLTPLVVVEPEGFNNITDDVWELIVMYVDSGATETVLTENMLSMLDMKESLQSKRGVTYEVANGVRIPNLGEKKFIGHTEDGHARNLTAQVCEVNKALLSVSKIVKAGNRVVFGDDEGNFIEDKATKERMYIEEEGGMYALKMWVRRDGLHADAPF